jgi:hypothetical protein
VFWCLLLFSLNQNRAVTHGEQFLIAPISTVFAWNPSNPGMNLHRMMAIFVNVFCDLSGGWFEFFCVIVTSKKKMKKKNFDFE